MPTASSASENSLDASAPPLETTANSTPRSAYLSAPSSPSYSPRCSSPVVALRGHHVRSSSFHRLKQHMQRAWRWGPGENGGGREQGMRTTVNLEVLAHQKRQWYQINSRARDHKHRKDPSSLFEHFVIVGLHSDSNVEVVEEAFAKRKIWESEVAKSEVLELRRLHHHGQPPSFEPQILFKYPPGKILAMREKDLPAFCFPGGVKARVLVRTPSMSELNEVIFGQEHLARDDLSFIFSLKVSDYSTLYGVCLHVQEIVQRAPGIFGSMSPPCKSGHHLVSAPRCYCLLTRVPFFELHYEMLNSIIAQERLHRITQFVNEMSLVDFVPPEHFDSPDRQLLSWMNYAIPVESATSFTSFSAGPGSERETSPFSMRVSEPQSPESIYTSDASDFSHLRELDKGTKKAVLSYDDYASETSESRSDSFERVNGENGQNSPDVVMNQFFPSKRIERVESLESIHSSVKGAGSDDEDEEFYSRDEAISFDQKVLEWAKARNNEALEIVCSYHALPLPSWGREIIFCPLEHLQPIKYSRPGLHSLNADFAVSDVEITLSSEANEVKVCLATAEEALALSIWALAAVCRALSLQSVLSLIAGALLEKQVLVICPNLGVLSAVVLSVIPMIRPFEWQSLFLPVLPGKLFDLLDAPVPFIVGVQHKPVDFRIKTANLVRIDVCKDQVKTCSLPSLPRYKELVSELSPIHARLMSEDFIAKRHPVYKCSEVQAEAAGNFLVVMRRYLESICLDLRLHTITNVQSNNDKVSLLLKDSFIDSFPSRDQPFMKLFVDTQMFSVLSDRRLSSFELE